MENLSPENVKIRLPLSIDIRHYLLDHYFDGRAIFPAVEIMIALARVVRAHDPQAPLGMIAGAQFNRMLILDQEGGAKQAHVELEPAAGGGVIVSLLTSVKIQSGSMTRSLEHARMTFCTAAVLPEPIMSARALRKLEGDCIQVPAAAIYRDLVPFGPSYRNITNDLSVARSGAVADISGGGEADDTLLGSPFVMDAAMHAACVWGQRYCGIVCFPVGFDRRIIYTPTRKGGAYLARVTPVEVSQDPFVFDVWIFDANGVIYEEIKGLKMRDVTRGRAKPPGWIREGLCKTSS